VSEEGLPHTPVRLWVSGESWRAAFENVVLAEYHCRDDWQDHKVKDIHGGMFYPTRIASPQGTLIPFTPQESLVVYRPKLDFCPFCLAKGGNFLWSKTFSPSAMQDMLLI
jgi:hypothetical protein